MLGGFLTTIARTILGDEESEGSPLSGPGSPPLRPNPNADDQNTNIENINSFVADTSPGLV